MKHITLGELRSMTDTEGLVLQGCGGDLDEWVSGINELLTENDILLDGDKFNDISTFEHDGLTNLLFSMDGVKLDVGKLAMWRLQSRDTFGGYWLSDYLCNRLGVNTDVPQQQSKPKFQLVGADGNVFNLIGVVAQTLKRNGMSDEANEMRERVMASGSYDNALVIMMEYVEPVSQDEMDCGMDKQTM